MEKTAIVILGASNDEAGTLSSFGKERCDQAISEFRAHAGSSVIPTGGWGQHFNTTSRPHGHYLREYLQTQGIPEEAFVECVESSNTIEDAKFCRPVVERYGFRRLVVVTSDFHLDRARFLFGREFPDIALTFSVSATDLPEEELQRRISHERNALARLQQMEPAGGQS
ncbi:MAG TPA: YdcF family protein [Verrucomicrobiales bacterium]|nr:YdcF family protein [Verrucomicrobiales bacterium]